MNLYEIISTEAEAMDWLKVACVSKSDLKYLKFNNGKVDCIGLNGDFRLKWDVLKV